MINIDGQLMFSFRLDDKKAGVPLSCWDEDQFSASMLWWIPKLNEMSCWGFVWGKRSHLQRKSARSKGVNCQVHSSSSSSSSFHWSISPLIYQHSRNLYKSRRTPSTQTLLMISSSEQLMDLLLALINIKLFKNFDGWPLGEPGFYLNFYLWMCVWAGLGFMYSSCLRSLSFHSFSSHFFCLLIRGCGKRCGFAGAVRVCVGGGKPRASQCKINMDGGGANESGSSVLPSAHATMCVEPHRWLLSLSRLVFFFSNIA